MCENEKSFGGAKRHKCARKRSRGDAFGNTRRMFAAWPLPLLPTLCHPDRQPTQQRRRSCQRFEFINVTDPGGAVSPSSRPKPLRSIEGSSVSRQIGAVSSHDATGLYYRMSDLSLLALSAQQKSLVRVGMATGKSPSGIDPPSPSPRGGKFPGPVPVRTRGESFFPSPSPRGDKSPWGSPFTAPFI
jgi:hypothetical protein